MSFEKFYRIYLNTFRKWSAACYDLIMEDNEENNRKQQKFDTELEAYRKAYQVLTGKKIDIESTGLIDKIIVTDKYGRKEYVFWS